MIFVAVAIVVGIFFLRGSSETVTMPGVTKVGVPSGPTTTKSIGPAGGSIASTDGRITVTVPPNAVPGPLNFSIQPITNLAQGGMGSAYRLQPDGLKFATPIKVSFRYDTPDFKAYRPETLAVAYQDPTGIWQAFKTANIDSASKTLTISTTHFTDESVFTDQLSPEKATLRVRGTQEVELKCTPPVLSWATWLKIRLGIGQLGSHCWTIDDSSWSVNAGTLVRTGPLSAVYQAPATIPSPNVATIRFVYHYKGRSTQKDVRTCEITIVGPGYRASGKVGTTVFSGDICDLGKEFSLKTNNPFWSSWKFVPSSPTEGTWSASMQNGFTGGGGGKYKITGTDALKTGIELNGFSTGTYRGITKSGGGSWHLDLAPLDKECKP
jgi:hypothetical protein